MQNQSSHNSTNNSQDNNKTITKCKSKIFFIFAALAFVCIVAGGLYYVQINNARSQQASPKNQSLYEQAAQNQCGNSCPVIASFGFLIAETYIKLNDNQDVNEPLLALQGILDRNQSLLESSYRERMRNLIDVLAYAQKFQRSSIAILKELEDAHDSIAGYSVSEKKFFRFLKIQKKEAKPADIAMKNKISDLIDEVKTKDMTMTAIYQAINRDNELRKYLSAISDELGVILSASAALKNALTLTKQQYLPCLISENGSAQNPLAKSTTEDMAIKENPEDTEGGMR